MKTSSLPAAVLLSMLLGASVNAAVVFSDNFNSYADTAALQAAWQQGTSTPGSNPTLGTSSTTPPIYQFTGTQPDKLNTLNPFTSNFMSLGNGVVYRDIGTTVTEDWTLNVSILTNQYSRSAYALLLDSTGTSGYGLLWNGTNINQNSGNGLVSIRKLNNASYTSWETFNTAVNAGLLGSALNPRGTGGTATGMITGYPLLAAPSTDQNAATYDTDNWQGFVDYSLTWVAATGQLTLYANGVQISQVIDTANTSFSRVYLRGNSNALFDDVSVEAIPEPTVTALVGLACGTGALLAWRRRRAVLKG